MIDLDSAFAALADPTRRAIVLQLSQGEATVAELAKPHRISQPAISRHLMVLEKAGMIHRRVDRTRRPCRLAPGVLTQLTAWIEMVVQGMEASYSHLDQLLEETNDTQ